MHNRIYMVAFLMLAVACNHTYKEYNKAAFPSYFWESDKSVTFKPVIEDVTQSYELTVGLRHLYGVLQVNQIPITVKSIAPSGKESMKEYQIKVKDSGNKYLSKCIGDYCDLETTIEQRLKFEEAGQYQFTITHNFDGSSIPGVMELGLIVDKE
jgi:gliding motility-associated lipoprotein GldH